MTATDMSGMCIGIHEHPCPVCYERKLCDYTCSRERELEDAMQSGSITECDDCRAAAFHDEIASVYRG